MCVRVFSDRWTDRSYYGENKTFLERYHTKVNLRIHWVSLFAFFSIIVKSVFFKGGVHLTKLFVHLKIYL